ncbi:MAG: putative lipid II flippase FtsW [Anaerolineae bacterium]|nr:putative lipid II flippase FtsW [Anaerolineae bacterium]
MSGREVTSGRNRQLRLIRMRTDYVLIVVVAMLLILGLMMVYSSTFDIAYRGWGNASRFLNLQLIWSALGTVALVVLARIDYHVWQRHAVLIMAAALIGLGAAVVFGQERFGASRWLFGGSVQPSEVAKIAVIIYIAAWTTSKGDKIRQVSYGLLPFFGILIALIVVLALYQSDLSTAVLIAVTALAMFFFAGADLMQLVVGSVFCGAGLAVLMITVPYRMRRLETFIDLSADPSGSAYQVKQALIALASGGFFGLGLGESRQKFGNVPFVHTDTILAVLAEELGLMGCLFLLGLFVVLAYRGFKIASEAEDPFGTILAAGLTCSLIVQALINMAAVTATLPYAGVPLPFISYGGSSLLASMASVGLLLSVSRGRREATGRERAHRLVGWGDRGSRVSPTRGSRGAQRRS